MIKWNLIFFFWVCQKTVLGNVIRKLHAKLHRVSLINKCFQIGENKSLTKKQKILFLERSWHISDNLQFLREKDSSIGKHLKLESTILANCCCRTLSPAAPPKFFLGLQGNFARQLILYFFVKTFNDGEKIQPPMMMDIYGT